MSLASEQDNFSQHLDQDGDGRLSRGEVRTWLMPLQHDYARAEVKTLNIASSRVNQF